MALCGQQRRRSRLFSVAGPAAGTPATAPDARRTTHRVARGRHARRVRSLAPTPPPLWLSQGGQQRRWWRYRRRQWVGRFPSHPTPWCAGGRGFGQDCGLLCRGEGGDSCPDECANPLPEGLFGRHGWWVRRVWLRVHPPWRRFTERHVFPALETGFPHRRARCPAALKGGGCGTAVFRGKAPRRWREGEPSSVAAYPPSALLRLCDVVFFFTPYLFFVFRLIRLADTILLAAPLRTGRWKRKSIHTHHLTHVRS